jgi:Fe-S-cluster containining protein
LSSFQQVGHLARAVGGTDETGGVGCDGEPAPPPAHVEAEVIGSAMAESRPPRTSYNCGRCPSYCCTYAQIAVTASDIRRLARHFGLAVEKAARRFTKPGPGRSGAIMRHRRDRYFGTACRFLHPEQRHCTVYAARPAICRAFPGTRRCGYYDFLAFERRVAEDPDLVAVTGGR